MNEADPSQKSYLDAAVRKAKARRCRCGSAALPIRANAWMMGGGVNAVSTSVHYQCPSCGYQFRIGLIGDSIGFLILASILAAVGTQGLVFGLILMPMALALFVSAVQKIRLKCRHPVIQPDKT
jgi:hypothetical protein